MPAKKKIPEEQILSTALQMLEANGYDSVNVKSLAAELGCSTQPIYLSYKNMDDLRRALSEAAVQKFIAVIDSSRSGQTGLYGVEYIRFAKEHKNLFCFLFMRKNAYRELKTALAPVIERSVQNLMSAYHLDHSRSEWIHDQLWMHSHGIASMIATDFCDWDMDKVSRMVEEEENIVLHG